MLICATPRSFRQRSWDSTHPGPLVAEKVLISKTSSSPCAKTDSRLAAMAWRSGLPQHRARGFSRDVRHSCEGVSRSIGADLPRGSGRRSMSLSHPGRSGVVMQPSANLVASPTQQQVGGTHCRAISPALSACKRARRAVSAVCWTGLRRYTACGCDSVVRGRANTSAAPMRWAAESEPNTSVGHAILPRGGL